MNTEGLKPIDARTMKPGDKCVDRQGRECHFFGYDDTVPFPHEHAAIRAGSGVVLGTTFDGRLASGSAHEFFLPSNPDPIDPSPGNVDKLRCSQVGEGWRIVEHGEKPDKRAHRWSIAGECWVAYCDPASGGPYHKEYTYRIPIAPVRMVPLSMEDLIGKPWPLVRETSLPHVIRSVLRVDSHGITPSRLGEVVWQLLRESFELSWDHGVTWVKAEKEEQPQ